MRTNRARFSLAVVLLWLAAALLPVIVSMGTPGSAYAQDKVYHMSRYDSDITVNSDGSLDVKETLIYVFDTGSFHRGIRTWDLGKVGGINNIKVAEQRSDVLFINYQETRFDPDSSTNGTPGTFGTERNGSTLRLRWVFDYTSNDTRTFRLTYHVDGAVRVYDTYYQFNWYAVPPEWGAPIDNSRVQVTFPTGSDTSKWDTASLPSNAEVSKQSNVIVWTAGGGLGKGFQVGVKQIPKSLLSATKPSWQAGVDAQEAIGPWLTLAALLVSVLILVGGILWSVMRWYKSGRDLPVSLPADYLAEPPSDLPPGLVGTLVDETSDVRDVIATVVDMGKKGNLTITETQKGGLLSAKEFEYHQTANNTKYPFEALLLDALFSSGQTISLSELKNEFYTKLPPIYDAMYKALVDLKYFPEDPKAVRSRNSAIGFGILALGIILGGLAFVSIGPIIPPAAVFPGVALGVVGIVRMLLAPAMPRKTDFGATEAARWRAFQRYLQSIQKYTNVQQAADKFQKYLPYAVALGVDREFINQFNSVPAAMPHWYAPYGYFPYPYIMGAPGMGGQSLGGSNVGAGPGGGGFDPGGAMQGMSNSLAGAMQGMSDSFTSMVNSASSVFTSQPSSSGGGGGGGWGGGGGGFGGGGGGGGGGGAD